MTDINEKPRTLIRCVLAARNQDCLSQMKLALAASNQVDVCAETTSYALAVSHVERGKPDFVFCGVDGDPQEAFSCIQRIRETNTMVRVVCVGERSDSETILQSFRTGADEFLIAPLQKESLLEMFSRLGTRRKTPVLEPVLERKGRSIAVWGSRGGCGVTTVACNLADVMAQNKSMMLVDLHETQGDLGLFFDQQSTYSLQDIWGRVDRLDEALVDSITVKLNGGLHLLLHGDDDRSAPWSESDFDRLMAILQAKYDYTLLDVGHDLEIVERIISSIDEICLVVNQTLPSLYLASRKVRWLEESGFNMDGMRILINAYNSRSSVTRNHIAKTLRIADAAIVRHDEKNVLSAINQGVPLRSVSRWGKAAKDIARVAEVLKKDAPNGDAKKEESGQLALKPLFSNSAPVEAL